MTKDLILITGASRGLGYRVAKSLLGQVPLLLTARYSRDDFLEMSGLPEGGFTYECLDFAEDPERFARRVERLAPVTTVVHNAAPYTEKGFFDQSVSEVLAFGKFMTNVTLLARCLDYKKWIQIGSCVVDPTLSLPPGGGTLYQQHKASLDALFGRLMDSGDRKVVIINPGPISEEAPPAPGSVDAAVVVQAIADSVLTSCRDGRVIPVYANQKKFDLKIARNERD